MLRTDLIGSVPELLKRHAKTRGQKLAYRDAKGSVTYADLEARTGRIAGHLADLGIGTGDTVAMLLPEFGRLGRGVVRDHAGGRTWRSHQL